MAHGEVADSVLDEGVVGQKATTEDDKEDDVGSAATHHVLSVV